MAIGSVGQCSKISELEFKLKELTMMSIAGARPNFMKIASIAQAVAHHNLNIKPGSDATSIRHLLVHTGQHYDHKMSHGFFEELGIPRPDINLEVGSGTHAQQTAEIMKRFEPILLQEKPDVLLVVGDVNSTIACTLVAAKIDYGTDAGRRRPAIVHVEAGLRSFDRDMPEEINRILTDALSDMLFVTEQSGIDNLTAEGVDEKKIHFVGNVMIDTLISHLKKIRDSDIINRLGVHAPYAVVTLHRPSNVDSKEILVSLADVLLEISESLPIVFPVHPRTRNRMEEFGIIDELLRRGRIICTEPLGYLDFLSLVQGAILVITDSGGIQEETTYLKIPCITLRANTERPVTVMAGSNYLIGIDSFRIVETAKNVIYGKSKQYSTPFLWDGKSGERIISIITDYFANA